MRQREILNAAKEQAGMTQKEFAKYFGIPLRNNSLEIYQEILYEVRRYANGNVDCIQQIL